MKFQFLIFAPFILCGCFLIPRAQVRLALKVGRCEKLSSSLIYNLKPHEVKESLAICLKKEKYKAALVLLNFLEKDKNLPQSDLQKIWKQKGNIYLNKLHQYPRALIEFKKIPAQENKASKEIHFKIIKAHLKMKSFDKALKQVTSFLKKDVTPLEKLKLEFIKARLLLLLDQKKEALKIFGEIKTKSPRFFNKNGGAFYLSLLLEEEKEFDKAQKELQTSDWPFIEDKFRHWDNRSRQAPGN